MSKWILAVLVGATIAIASCGGDEAASPPEPSNLSTSTTLQALGPNDGDSGFAISDGHQIHYEVHGEGEPLVLVHGWGLNTESNWNQTGWIEALEQERQVVSVDIRGHGESDKPHDQQAYSYEAMAQDVLAVMDDLGIERADLVGYSLGAFSSAHLLGHEADRFTSAILIGIGDEDAASIATAPMIADALRVDDPSEITDPDAAFYRAAASADPRNDLEALAVAALQMWPEGFPTKLGGPGLNDVDIPTLILNGANDVPYVETDQDLADAIPGAVLIEIPDSDHLGVLVDDRFKDEVLKFLAGR